MLRGWGRVSEFGVDFNDGEALRVLFKFHLPPVSERKS